MLFYKHYHFISLSILYVICSSSVMSDTVGDKFEQDAITADLNLPNAPNYKVEVNYAAAKVDLGNKLSKSETKDKPVSIKWPTESGKYYSVIFVDPDAPNRQQHQAREWRHWVVINIRENKIDVGDTLTDYKGPSPPAGTGFHRYVFLIYEQDGQLTRIQIPDNRAGWKVNDFASKHNLRLVAGNYFQITEMDFLISSNIAFAETPMHRLKYRTISSCAQSLTPDKTSLIKRSNDISFYKTCS